MKQIKTIYDANSKYFDDTVNEALKEGWELVRRSFDDHGFLAELERDIITEAERTCENCAHYDKDPSKEPCVSCENDCSNWEEVEG